MIPTIYPKDGIFFQPVAFNKIKVYDIILFEQRKKLVAHRVIFKAKRYVICKGDNNPYSDGKIYSNQIIGSVYKIKRNGKIFNLDYLYLIQSTVYFEEIVKIKRAFEKEKIDFLFLKGLPLHLYYEKSPPKRIYSDCDVLIDKSRYKDVRRVLFKHGYKINFMSSSFWRKKQLNRQVEVNFTKIVSGFEVIFDVHFEPAFFFLMTQFPALEAFYSQKLIDKLTKELLVNKREIIINDEKFFILDTKYLVLYLALHIFHHNFRGAFRYQFLDKINRKSRFLWKELEEKIKEYRLQNFVYPVFILLKKYYQTPVPNFFTKLIEPSNNFARKQFNNLNVFDEDPPVRAGVNRFLNISLLSPNPLWKKLLVFINLEVFSAGFFVFSNKIRRILGKIISPRH
jgi:signal peptidase I